MEILSAANYSDSVKGILEAEKLPVSDLPQNLEDFSVAIENNETLGVAGLEIYGNYALLRSLAVKARFRGRGIAGRLLEQIEALALSKGVDIIYLLTETAPEYFEKQGFVQISRADVPAEIQKSSEFSYVCPQSAAVMKKTLK
ncbi:MAG TPA: arsenic resistance N-acetyltransferase ArsN2 [Mucilaginibacter sp.]|nr:arsenic resistance N-acetyltransferase ArsN2 [Mucilaginibacter sp.]